MRYELYYWGSIQGRGEFVRLALEEAGAGYVDVVRTEGGEDRMLARAADFIANRLPKFMDYFERVLGGNPGGSAYLVGSRVTYADLSLFQAVAGLHYAFPKAMARLARRHRRVMTLYARVAARKRIAAYLASERRLPFNQEGSFRHYAELDR